MVLLKPKEKSPSTEGLFLRFLFVCGILNKKRGRNMKIGDFAGDILLDYMICGKNVKITSIDENTESFCVCIGLSDGTWWFIGEDCVVCVPERINTSRVILMEDGYAWDDGSLIPWLIG